MEELRKVRRVIERRDPTAPHEVLLVLDATTGQNALIQAKAFSEAVDVTAIALTKLDGTSKGGIVFAISDELGLPVRFVGTGEGEDDLSPFDARRFRRSPVRVARWRAWQRQPDDRRDLSPGGWSSRRRASRPADRVCLVPTPAGLGLRLRQTPGPAPDRYLFWLALTAHILPNRPGSIVWVLLLLIAIDVIIVRRRKSEMGRVLEQRATLSSPSRLFSSLALFVGGAHRVLRAGDLRHREADGLHAAQYAGPQPLLPASRSLAVWLQR